MNKITTETRALIHALFNDGKNKPEIARLTGVSYAMVNYILFPEKLISDRKKAVKNENTARLNRERVKRCRERMKDSK